MIPETHDAQPLLNQSQTPPPAVKWNGVTVSMIKSAINALEFESKTGRPKKGCFACLPNPIAKMCIRPILLNEEEEDGKEKLERLDSIHSLVQNYKELQSTGNRELPKGFLCKFIPFMTEAHRHAYPFSLEQIIIMHHQMPLEDWSDFLEDYKKREKVKGSVVESWVNLKNWNSEEFERMLSERTLAPFLWDPSIAEKFLHKMPLSYLNSEKLVDLLIEQLPINWELIPGIESLEDQRTVLKIFASFVHHTTPFDKAHAKTATQFLEKRKKQPPKPNLEKQTKRLSSGTIEALNEIGLPDNFEKALIVAEGLLKGSEKMYNPLIENAKKKLTEALIQKLQDRLTFEHLPKVWHRCHDQPHSLAYHACLRKATEDPRSVMRSFEDQKLYKLVHLALQYKENKKKAPQGQN